MCIAEIYREGRVSQNVDLGLSFCFMQLRRRHLKKKKKCYPFYHTIKYRA